MNTQATGAIRPKSAKVRPVIIAHVRLFPKLQARASDPTAYPRHKLCGIYFGDAEREITLQFHTAGSQVIWELPVRAALHDRVVRGVTSEDAFQIGWYAAENWQRNLNRELAALRGNGA
ncbi:MAG: hypothetical protein PHE55_18180 [Methylococcaceae bacterium]|nr:hypothetical protein [Methylococcaceae bacterium]